MQKKKYASLLAVAMLVGAFGVATAAHAESNNNGTATPQMGQQQMQNGGQGKLGMMRGGQGMRQGVFGKVTVVSGNTITATETNPKTQAVTTYTIDATNAKVEKAGAASSVSAIAIGDTIMVQGTVTGTTVAATNIHDGIGMRGQKPAGAPNKEAIFDGNGQPIIGGTVTAVSGSTISITNKGGTVYTIDATNAKFTKDGAATATIANVAVGDSVLAQGMINGTAVTATTVADHGTAPLAGTNGTDAKGPARGFFGAIGNFFSHIFGFGK